MEDWDAVAAAINSRMRELRMTQMDLASRSGVSIATIRDLQHNRSPRQRRARTLAALSTGLGWPSEHLDRICRGAAVDTATGTSSEYDDVMSQLDALQDQVRSVGERLGRLERLVDQRDSTEP